MTMSKKGISFEDIARYIFVAGLIYLTFEILGGREPYVLHSVNLIFHEAGHMIFMFFGDFITALGGTLMQLIVPIMFLIYFFVQRNFFASTVMLWWFGQNLIDISIYLSDARARVLPLLGGGDGHDWAYLLGELNLLKHDLFIGGLIYTLGVFIMFGALALSLFVIKKRLSAESRY